MNERVDVEEMQFKRLNTRDEEHEYVREENIKGFKDHILIFNSLSNTRSKPWYTNKNAFWFMTIIGLGWLFRIIFVSNTKRVQFTFVK